MHGRRTFLAAAVAATLVFWASAFVGIRALGQELDPGPLALARLLTAAGILGVAVGVRERRLPNRQGIVRLSIGGVLWPGTYFVLLNASERNIDAGTAAVLIKLAPIFVAFAAFRVLGERPSLRLVTGCLVALGGVAIVGLGGRGDAVGVGYALAAALACAAGILVQKSALGRTTPLTATWIATSAGAIACAPFSGQLLRQLPNVSTSSAWWLLFLGVFPTAVAFSTWAYALARMPASRLGATTYAIPPLTLLLSWWLLDETPPARSNFGATVCIAGIVVALYKGSRPSTKPPRTSLIHEPNKEAFLADGDARVP